MDPYALIRGTTLSRVVYTSPITMRIDSTTGPYLTIGPLAYITDQASKPTSRNGRMDHRMLEGDYQIHRVKNTMFGLDPRQPPTSATFTVITLQEVCPLKAVNYVARGVVTNDYLFSTGRVFDEYRWMKLATSNVPRRSKDIDKMKIIASSLPSAIQSREMATRNDFNTVYLHLKSMNMAEPLTVSPMHPEISEFVISNLRGPAVVGVILPETHIGVYGCVLYSHSLMNGLNLCKNRAFAVIIGPRSLISSNRIGANIVYPTWCGYLRKNAVVVLANQLCSPKAIRDADEKDERAVKRVKLDPATVLHPPSIADVHRSKTDVLAGAIRGSPHRDVVLEDVDGLPDDVLEYLFEQLDCKSFASRDLSDIEEWLRTPSNI